MPRGEVRIFENWCKGCGLCIEFCPAGVLVLGMDNRPKPIYPENCIACRWCELHCPDFAIYIIDLVEEMSDESTPGADRETGRTQGTEPDVRYGDETLSETDAQ
jgi:2-oxoglutarate ferredoxin oxidoreductase subunit delta